MNSATYFFFEWVILHKGFTEEDWNKLSKEEEAALRKEHAEWKTANNV